ncbi:MAG: EF-hand domain-containing protein [bacterium]|nr:EF-hand domain-containing protein [bacterium]
MSGAINGLGAYQSGMHIRRPNEGQAFKKHDVNEDGFLDSNEMQSILDKVEDKTGRSLDRNQIISTIDANSDGLIDKDEFRAGRDKVRDIIGPPNKLHKPERPGDDKFSDVLMNMLNEDTQEDDSSLTTNEDYLAKNLFSNFNNTLIQSYINNAGNQTKNNPFNLLA